MDIREKYLEYFESIEKDNAEIKAYKTITKDEAMAALENNDNPFPVVFADQISTKGIKTTANSKMLENYIPPFDATVVERIKNAGGVILGKTITKEFGVGETENSFGACAAVAHGDDIVGISTGHKGFMHLGAHEYNLFAYKATYGLVSRYGIIPVASSLDRVGILSKSFKNIPKILDIVTGKDERDSASFPCDIDFINLDEIKLDELKVANLDKFGHFEETEKLFERLNIPTKKSDIEGLEYAIPTYEIISSGEFATNMERFDGISFGHRSDNYNNVEELYKNSRTEAFGRVVQQKIMFGNFVLSEGRYENFYVQALKSRTMIKENTEKLLDEVEFLIAPVSLYYTAGLNLAGLPSISIPFGEEGLLIATKAFNDKRLLEFVNKLISEIEGDK
ncbi:MAG: hypothetical protein GX666_06445 [Tissierellia bacterium]|nr:hypothetical protein [Tissierellia bacterium]